MQKGIDYEVMGLKSNQEIVMPLAYYPVMDDCDHTNRLCTISPSKPSDPTKIAASMTTPAPTDNGARTFPAATAETNTTTIPPAPT
jgi:hypothetical protein